MEQNAILQSATAQEAYERSCMALGEQPKTLDQFNAFFGERTGYWEFSQHRITTVIEAVKGGRQFDWDNSREWKYYPWFDMRTKNNSVPGSGFSFTGCGYDRTYSHVGARLSSFSSEIVKRVAELMHEDYKNWVKG